MSHVPWSVSVFVCVCVLVTLVSPAINCLTDRDALLGLDSRGSKEPPISLHGSQDPPKIGAIFWVGAPVGEL